MDSGTPRSLSSGRANGPDPLAASGMTTAEFFISLLVLLSQKVAAAGRSDSVKRGDSSISR